MTTGSQDGPPAPPAPDSPAANGDAKYASDEYAIGADTDHYDDNDPSALHDFRQPLAPYGNWSDDATYGTVWTPAPDAVGPDFTPYVSSGHWAYDDDYVWVSDYSWGWAPFHYGRWVMIGGRGWAWIPGREYRGAWVNWSVDDGYSYLGWAPMGPSFVWFGGVPVGWRGAYGPRWAYVPRGEVFAPRVGARVVVGPSAIAIGGRMHPFVASEGHLAGPPPARFGYASSQIPRPAGALSVSRAQQFSRPSTARALGASAPSARVDSRASIANGTRVNDVRGPLTSGARPAVSSTPRPAGGFSTAPRMAAPSSGLPNAGHGAAPAAPMRAPAPAFHPSGPSGGFHGGGGGHHR